MHYICLSSSFLSKWFVAIVKENQLLVLEKYFPKDLTCARSWLLDLCFKFFTQQKALSYDITAT